MGIDLESVWPGWHVEGMLGSGSSGNVYKVAHKELGHVSYAAAKRVDLPKDPAVIESLRRSGMDDDGIRAYLRQAVGSIVREIEIMESLKGARNVVFIEDYRLIEHEGGLSWTIWIRMELLKGLVEVAEHEGGLSVPEVVDLGIDICNALDCCHSYGIIHRDVKPQNVFRSSFGEFKLGDFGIAGRLGRAGSQRRPLGTMMYAAPEIARGESYDARADIYSLGIMLYRYLNGHRYPYQAETGHEPTDEELKRAFARRMQDQRMPAPRDADERLARIVTKACAYDRDRRYMSASDLRDDLVAWKRANARRAANTSSYAAIFVAAIAILVAFWLVFTGLVVQEDDQVRAQAVSESVAQGQESPLEAGTDQEAAVPRTDDADGIQAPVAADVGGPELGAGGGPDKELVADVGEVLVAADGEGLEGDDGVASGEGALEGGYDYDGSEPAVDVDSYEGTGYEVMDAGGGAPDETETSGIGEGANSPGGAGIG